MIKYYTKGIEYKEQDEYTKAGILLHKVLELNPDFSQSLEALNEMTEELNYEVEKHDDKKIWLDN